MRVSFTKLQHLPDPSHGLPIARSSHGFSCMKVNSKLYLVLMFGEHVSRTPIPLEQAIWIAETVVDPELDESKINWSNVKWTWRMVDSSKQLVYPQPRLAHSQTMVGDSIYIFGGRVGVDMNETSLGDLWKFHVPSETWTFIDTSDQCQKDVPEARSFHRIVSVDTSIYLFGGCGGTSGKRLNDLYRFDTIACKWHKLENSALLAGRGGPNVLVLRNSHQEKYLAIVAGFKGEETNDGHIYNLTSGSWAASTMSGLTCLRPRSVCVFGSISSANIGIIFGGEVDPSEKGHEGAGGFTNDLVLIDGASETILETLMAPQDASLKLPWPEERGWTDGAVYESKQGTGSLFFFGGLSGDDENPRRLDDLWVCNLEEPNL